MFRCAYPAPLNDIGRQHVWPRLPSQEETIARSSKQCACGRCPAQAAAERHRHIRSEDMFNKSRRSRYGRSGGRRPFRAPRTVEIDTSRRLQGSDFRPAKRVARERTSESQRMHGGMNLPEMDGSELCSALAASGRGLPAILITGRNDLATQRLIEKAHVVTALFKPIDERALFDAIARSLALSDG